MSVNSLSTVSSLNHYSLPGGDDTAPLPGAVKPDAAVATPEMDAPQTVTARQRQEPTEEQRAWLDGKTPPRTTMPALADYRRALRQFGAKDSEEFRQKYLKGFSEADLQLVKPQPEAVRQPARRQTTEVARRSQIEQPTAQQSKLLKNPTARQNGVRMSAQAAVAQQNSNRKGLDSGGLPVVFSPDEVLRLRNLAQTTDARFEVLESAVRNSGLHYSDQAINKTLSEFRDDHSIVGSDGKHQTADQIKKDLESGSYEMTLTSGLRRKLYRAEMEIKGDPKALAKYDLDVKVFVRLAEIDKEIDQIKPKNDLHRSFLELARQTMKKDAVGELVKAASIDPRATDSELERTTNTVADGSERAFKTLVDNHPIYRFLPESAKEQIVDFQLGMMRGGVQLAGTVKGFNDFVADAANDVLLTGLEQTGLDKKLGVDTNRVREHFRQERAADAKLWSTITNAGTARMAKNDLAYQMKIEQGLNVTPYDVPNWATKGGEMATKAVPFLIVGAATGGASIGVQVAVSGTVAGLQAGSEVYNQTRNRPEAVKAAAWGAAQGAVAPLTNRLGVTKDLAASAAIGYVTTKIQNPNASDADLIQGIVLQTGMSGGFAAGSKLRLAMDARAGKPLTEAEAKTQYEATVKENLTALKEEVGNSAARQTEAFVRQTEVDTVVRDLERQAKNGGRTAQSNEATTARARVKTQAQEIISNWGKDNKIVTRQQYNQARAELRQIKMYSGIPVDQIPALSKIAAHHLEAGARGFDNFVKAIKAETANGSVKLDDADLQKLYKDASDKHLTDLRGKLSEAGAAELDSMRAKLGDEATLQKLPVAEADALKTLEPTSPNTTAPPANAKPPIAETKFWNENGLGLGAIVEKALTRADLDQTTAKSVSETLVRIKDAIKNNKLETSGSLRDLVSSLGKSDPKKVSESLAELERAAEVVGNEDLAANTKVIIGARDGQQITKATGLPDIDVPKVEADVYYKTADGVLHLNEVKDTFNALTSKLDQSARATATGVAEGKQFNRYEQWIGKGEKAGEIRQVAVSVRKSGPGFDELLDPTRLKLLSETIGKNPDQPILQVGERTFTVNDLNKILGDAKSKLGELKKQNPSKSFVDLSKEHFGSIEKAFETLGKEYGTKVGGGK